MSQADTSQVAGFYDQWWRYPREAATPMQLSRRRMLLRYLSRIGPTGRILDLGCGPGLAARTLGQFGQLWGLDVSPEAIRQAQRRYPPGRFIVGDLYTAQLGRAAFDVVAALDVIEHVPDQQAFLGRCYQLLKPGGHLLLSAPNRYVWQRWYGRARFFSDELLSMPEMHRRGYLQPIEHWLTLSELRSLLAERFNVLEMTTTGFGAGCRDWLRLANSHKLAVMVRALRLERQWDWLRGRLGWGAKIVALAQAKPARKILKPASTAGSQVVTAMVQQPSTSYASIKAP